MKRSPFLLIAFGLLWACSDLSTDPQAIDSFGVVPSMDIVASLSEPDMEPDKDGDGFFCQATTPVKVRLTKDGPVTIWPRCSDNRSPFGLICDENNKCRFINPCPGNMEVQPASNALLEPFCR